MRDNPRRGVSLEFIGVIMIAAALFGSIAIVQHRVLRDQKALMNLVATHEARLKTLEDRLNIKPSWERIVK